MLCSRPCSGLTLLTVGCTPSGPTPPASVPNSTSAGPVGGANRQRACLRQLARHPRRTAVSAYQTRYVAQQAAEPSTRSDPLDWLFWRGPRYDGISHETGLVDDFDPRRRAGQQCPVETRRSGRTQHADRDGRATLYVLLRAEPGTSREGEKVVCVNAETGETIWENRFNVYLSDVPDTRVGWSACVGDPETGSVFAQGVCGHFQCLDAQTGQTRWYVPLHEQFGLLSTYGGRTNFPVICEDLVIVSGVIIGWGDMAKPAHRMIAFDKRTGEVVWFSGTRELPEDTTYSSPTLTVLNQQHALVFGSGDGAIWAFQPRTGRPIWELRPVAAGRQRSAAGRRIARLRGTQRGESCRHDDGRPGGNRHGEPPTTWEPT